jgi:putative methylase
MQKRLVRKLDLEIAISRVEPHPSPKAELEQYTIPPEAAAELLYIAAYTNNDVVGKTIADLGCGTGRLAIGSILLGAKECLGIDIDRTAVKTAHSNAIRMGVKEKTQWVIADIAALHGTFDTVLQNPPFGVQKRKADRRFLEKALEIGNRAYSMHKSNRAEVGCVRASRGHKHKLTSGFPSHFLDKFIAERGGRITAIYTMQMTIPRLFDFHTKTKHRFAVDLYVMERAKPRLIVT